MATTPVAAPPGASPRPEGSTFRRRKFVDKGGTRGRGALDFSALEGAIESDGAAVESLRRDVKSFQEMEMESSYEYLAVLRKTHDKLRATAQQKEQEHMHIVSKLDELNRLCAEQKGAKASEAPAQDKHCSNLEAELRVLEKKLKSTVVQRDIYHHMLGRLERESVDLDREGEQLERDLEKYRGEVQACTRALQLAKQELKNEENKLKTLQSKVSDRRENQRQRTKDIEKALNERTSLLERQEERQRLRQEVFEQSAQDAGGLEEAKLKKMQVVRRVYSSMLEKQMYAEEDDLGDLEETFQRIKMVTGLSDVDEIVHKFLSRSEKAQQLEHDADEIRQRIEELKKQNDAQRQILEAMKAESQNTAGNRKAIFEMEKSAQDLQDLRNQCDEAKTRAYRSNVALEELRTAAARFRSKVEGRAFQPPKSDQLPDFLKELDIRLAAKMRGISDLLGQGEGGGPTKPQAEKAADMPYAKSQSRRMSEMLFQKMMQTVPDSGTRNVRVIVRPNMDDLNRRHRRALLDDYYNDFIEPDAALDDAGEIEHDGKEPDLKDLVVDRKTVKKISSMVAQRDGNKASRRRKGKQGHTGNHD